MSRKEGKGRGRGKGSELVRVRELNKDQALDVTPEGRSEELFQQLAESRRISAAVSMACGAVGFVPLPLLPDLAITALRSALLHRIAAQRGVELDYESARAITGDKGLSVKRLASSVAGLRSGFTRTLLMFMRFEEVARTFLLAIYIDYYLLRHHRGDEVAPAQAAMLRIVVEEATSGAHVDVISALFQKAVGDAVRMGLVVPRTFWTYAMTLLHRGEDGMEHVTEEDVSGQRFLSSVVRFVERELDRTGRETLEAVLDGFDEALAARERGAR